jgi:hypothetical protein
MKSAEHRAVGHAAAAGAFVHVGGNSAEDSLVLGYGDVVALSGDFFASNTRDAHRGEGCDERRDGLAAADLFELAAIAGRQGTQPGTRDEIICALKVMEVDGGFVDARFEPGGSFGDFHFTPTAAVTEVERRVRDRFLALAAANGDHFVTPGPPDTTGGDHDCPSCPPGSQFDSAAIAYRRLHEVALEQACQLGQCRGDLSRAMAREAAAQHYLTDAFAAGHLRTPVTAIRQFWHRRYPQFWPSLQHTVAADTTAALRELTPLARFLPTDVLYDHALAAVEARTTRFPPISLGDLLARVFHDWDDDHGLIIDGGGVLFGDGHLDQGVGKQLAVAAARAGIDDIEVAYQLGVSGSRLCGQALYHAVRSVTGAPHDTFRAETLIPTPSADNPPQNWQTPDIETLWNSPIVGTTGATVGMAVEHTLQKGGEVFGRLDRLGPGVLELPGLLGMPVLRRWAARKASHAYHHGFIRHLSQDPKATVLAVVDHQDSAHTSAPSQGATAQPLQTVV